MGRKIKEPTVEDLFLQELKLLLEKYNLTIEDDYGWGFDGENESLDYFGAYFRGKDFSIKIGDDLWKHIKSLK